MDAAAPLSSHHADKRSLKSQLSADRYPVPTKTPAQSLPTTMLHSHLTASNNQRCNATNCTDSTVSTYSSNIVLYPIRTFICDNYQLF